jgi:hypothetical protein
MVNFLLASLIFVTNYKYPSINALQRPCSGDFELKKTLQKSASYLENSHQKLPLTLTCRRRVEEKDCRSKNTTLNHIVHLTHGWSLITSPDPTSY